MTAVCHARKHFVRVSRSSVMQHWGIIPTMSDETPHRLTALDHLAAVQAYSDNLRDEWRKDRPDPTDVKYLTASIGRGLKLAEIHASLEIADQVRRLADRLNDDDSIDFLARPATSLMTRRLVDGR